MLKLRRQVTLKRSNKERRKSKQSQLKKKKIVPGEITDVLKKKARLQESINELIKDVVKLAFEAETKNDFKLVRR